MGHCPFRALLTAKIGHLRIEGVDARLHEHVGENKVLEAGRPPGTAAFVVILERFEEVGMRFLELALSQVHLAAAFPDHA